MRNNVFVALPTRGGMNYLVRTGYVMVASCFSYLGLYHTAINCKDGHLKSILRAFEDTASVKVSL